MKRLLRFALGFLLLAFAFRQAALVRDLSPAVSLRFDSPFSVEQAGAFAAVWAQEQTAASGQEATLIRFAGDAQVAFPAPWLYGTPPNDRMADSCAVSSHLAWDIYGGGDVTGLTVELSGEEYTICGVFDHGESVLLVPDAGDFTAAELFPAPAGTDLHRHARDCAARSGLPEPSQILCGPEAAFLAGVLPWLCAMVSAWPLLRRAAQGRRWLWLAAAMLLILAVPDWFWPTRWSDTVYWRELAQSLTARVRDWLTLAPALRDVAVKGAWLWLVAAVPAALCLLKPPKGP